MSFKTTHGNPTGDTWPVSLTFSRVSVLPSSGSYGVTAGLRWINVLQSTNSNRITSRPIIVRGEQEEGR